MSTRTRSATRSTNDNTGKISNRFSDFSTKHPKSTSFIMGLVLVLCAAIYIGNVYYTYQLGQAMNNNDNATATNDYKISSWLAYIICAFGLVGLFLDAKRQWFQ